MQAHERRLLIFGFGYTGERFCLRQQAAGWQVQAVVRSKEAGERVEAVGATAVDLNNAAANTINGTSSVSRRRERSAG